MKATLKSQIKELKTEIQLTLKNLWQYSQQKVKKTQNKKKLEDIKQVLNILVNYTNKQ